MVTGRKRMAQLSEPPTMASFTRAAIGVALSAAVTLWVAAGVPTG